MSNDLNNENNEKNEVKEENFAELFEAYNTEISDDLQVGDKVKGEIISIGMDTVFVSTGTKVDGAVDKIELLDENGELTYQKGDFLELYVVSQSETEIRLSKSISGAGGLNLLQDAYNAKIPVEGKILQECKGGVHVDIMQRRAFCPVSQLDIKYVEKAEEYVGQTFEFLITRFEENGRNIVISRREILEKERKKASKEFLKTMKEGDVLEGQVSNIMPYGAFVSIFPGIEGMVHVSEMSWSRVQDPNDVLKKGDNVQVKIIGIGEGKKPGELKISLSMKQISGDPWEQGDFPFHPGDKIKGTVTRLADFGAFVEIASGIEGLVHISEMSYTQRVMRPHDVVQEGESVDVLVREVDLKNHRISLSIRDAEGDPWIGVGDKYSVGQKIEGTIEKVEKFGCFITVEPGITALMPKSKIAKSEKRNAIEKLKAGDPISAVIEQIQPQERKMTLGPGDSTEEGNWQQYSRGNKSHSMDSLGMLGEKLREAMKDKK